jgi:hypothetical protein
MDQEEQRSEKACCCAETYISQEIEQKHCATKMKQQRNQVIRKRRGVEKLISNRMRHELQRPVECALLACAFYRLAGEKLWHQREVMDILISYDKILIIIKKPSTKRWKIDD